MAALSKAEYLKRYLGGGGAAAPEEEAARRRRKKKARGAAKPAGGRGMRIVDDDDVGWKDPDSKQEKALDEDDELPVVAEFVDERPKEIKLMEEFRSGNKWKVLRDDNEDSQGSDLSVVAKSTASSEARSKERETEGSRQSPDLSPSRKTRHDSPESSPFRTGRDDSPVHSPLQRRRHDSPEHSSPPRVRHDSPDLSPPPRKGRHDSPDLSLPRKGRHDSPDLSPPRKGRHDSPDLSPPRKGRQTSPDISVLGRRNGKTTERPSAASRPTGRGSPSHQKRDSSSDLSPPRNRRNDSDADVSPPRKKPTVAASGKKPSDMRGPTASPKRRKRHNSSASPPPRRPPVARSSPDSDLSPRNRGRSGARAPGSDSDLSPPRRTSRKSPDSDLSPPRRPLAARGSPPRQRGDASQASQMLSGGKAGLVSAEVLKKEKKDTKRKERENKPLEEDSKTAETVFRDKSGRKRDLQQEREEKRRTAGVKSQREEQYAQWGQGLAQRQMQQQNVLDAAKEIDKPLARYIDDQDLDQMLREQERDGDPMANFIKKKKVKEDTRKKARPRYSGPAPPPNRFDIWPGHRWDGVDRSNGFEQKRYARQADKKAVEELAYKWSVEDM